MKRILFLAMTMFLIQSLAYADEDRGKGEKFEKMKAKVVENINKRRDLLNDFERCVKSASSREDMKSCRKNNKGKMEALRSERKKMKKKRKNREK
jgi:hypothetical protein